MSDFTVRLDGTEKTIAELRKRQQATKRAILKALRLSSEIVLARATENVSGRILKVQTGTLRRRLSYHLLADQMESRVGSPTVYAPVHEYGAVIQHPGGTAYYFNDRTGLAVWLSNKKAGAHPFPRTKPHSIPIPARPWLRPALSDSRADMNRAFQDSLSAAIVTGEAAP